MKNNFLNSNCWEDETNATRNQMVFASRNQHYGAYAIRGAYHTNIAGAIGLCLSAVIVVWSGLKLLLPHESDFFAGSTSVVEQITVEVEKRVEIPKEIVEVAKAVHSEDRNTQSKLFVVEDEHQNEEKINFESSEKKEGTSALIGDIIGDGNEFENITIIEEKVEEEKPLLFVEEMPIFPGGEEALFRFLQQNIQYPTASKEQGIKGTVIVGFVIDKTGKPIMLNILRGIMGGRELEEEALRVMGMMPNWSIGKQNGRATPVQFSIPVRFNLR